MLRVAVVGARRQRQGTGEFIARAFAQQGCRVESILGTSEASVAAARRGLEERYQIEARGYTSLASLLEREKPDVVAIASPAEHHLAALEPALQAGCHVFCEKPLFWGASYENAEAEAAVRADAERVFELARNQKRLLAVNTQWPETLDSFRALHPHALDGPLETLEMWLSPLSSGPTMIVDAAPHVLSLVHALAAGAGTIQRVGPLPFFLPGRAVTLPFEYRRLEVKYPGGVTRVKLHLEQRLEAPRPAAYAINGRRVDRVIEPGYQQFFVAGEQRVPVPDPLERGVARFVRGVESGAATDRRAIVGAMEQLATLVSAVVP